MDTVNIREARRRLSALVDAAERGGVEYYLVEQDNCYDRDPFESMAISYRNLKQMGLS